MNSNDVIGVAFVLVVLLALVFGLKSMIRPKNMTQEEYERRLSESSGVAGSVMNSLQEAIHPRAAEAVAVQQDMRAGYYNDQEKAEGDADRNLAVNDEDRKQS